MLQAQEIAACCYEDFNGTKLSGGVAGAVPLVSFKARGQ